MKSDLPRELISESRLTASMADSAAVNHDIIFPLPSWEASAYAVDTSGAVLPHGGIDAPQKRHYEIAKRAIDITAAVLLLIVSLLLLTTIALTLKLTGRGPVLFKQRRLAQGGSEFCCYKFRTMVPDAEYQLQNRDDLREQFEQQYKLREDPRVTRLGAFLRKTSLDELPQLWNVLKGEMSLIGPRPIVPPELRKYGAYGKKLLSVPPGLSGMWQVYGRSDTSYAERVQLDMSYIDRRCLLLDLKLLLLTAGAILRGNGAY